jgi:hypothetical protein
VTVRKGENLSLVKKYRLTGDIHRGYGGAMTTAKSIAVALGRRRIAAAVGVVRTAVSNAIVRDKQFPASWYVAVSRLCAEDGIECPPELFGMRGISDKGQ